MKISIISEEWVTTEVLKHRKLLNSAFFPLMNLTFIIDGEKIYSLRAIIEKRCPQLLSAVNFIKKKKEKKGDFLGPVRFSVFFQVFPC